MNGSTTVQSRQVLSPFNRSLEQGPHISLSSLRMYMCACAKYRPLLIHFRIIFCQVHQALFCKMPTRAQFLAAGPAEVIPGTLCGICCKDMQLRHPIRLPCNPEHTFCKDCIIPWLLPHNRCIHDCEARPWHASPWTHVNRALIDSTVKNLIFTNLHCLDVEELGGCRELDWQGYLSKRREPTTTGVPVILHEHRYTRIEGLGLAVPEQLLLSTMTMANAIPILVAGSPGKTPFTSIEKQDWQAIVDALIAILPRSEMPLQQVESIPSVLRGKIESALSPGVASTSPFLQAGHARFEDLDLLLEYLAATAFLARAPVSMAEVFVARSFGTLSRSARLGLARMHL